MFRSECAQNLLKRSELHSEAIWCITTHSELEKIVSLRMDSKLAKTFRIAFSENIFRSEWAQNLLKRSELHSEAIWCITTHSELEKIVSLRMAQNLLKRSELHSELEKIVSLRMGSKLAKTFRIAF